MPKLILASASPRRKALLSQLGFDFDVVVSNIDECCLPGELPRTYVARLAQEKALSVKNSIETDVIVLGADTIVVLDDLILEKPRNKGDAERMLLSLSGRNHTVMTAISVVAMDRVHTLVVDTRVWFKPLTKNEIDEYWKTGEPVDKAGSYGIQGLGGKFVTRIEGSYHAVVGLPLFETDQLLHEFLNE